MTDPERDDNGRFRRGTVPADPTALTTEQLDKGLAGLKELMFTRINGDKELMLEKFTGVGEQFTFIERGRVEQKSDTQRSVEAALAAAKEAVREQTAAFALATAKSEAGFNKQLELLATASVQAGSVTNAVLGDVKTRVERMESNRQGGIDQTKMMLALVSGFLALLAIGGIIFGVVAGTTTPAR